MVVHTFLLERLRGGPLVGGQLGKHRKKKVRRRKEGLYPSTDFL
jgi:hypothetical protein